MTETYELNPRQRQLISIALADLRTKLEDAEKQACDIECVVAQVISDNDSFKAICEARATVAKRTYAVVKEIEDILHVLYA